MDEWKAAGSAGRKFEDALWKEFNAARQEFYSARSVYYDEVQKKQQVNYEEKKKLVQEAQDILDSNDFSRANTDRMKALSQDWKKVGYCGKEKDDRVWKEFRAVMDVYFDSLKKNNDQRHADWVARMEDAKERKQDMIANQKRQIERLEEESNGLISQGRAEEIRDQIEDKEDFIAQLESEIEDIDKKIAE
jgi:DNA-binding transcriptional regulator GbsR (MarR family)